MATSDDSLDRTATLRYRGLTGGCGVGVVWQGKDMGIRIVSNVVSGVAFHGRTGTCAMTILGAGASRVAIINALPFVGRNSSIRLRNRCAIRTACNRRFGVSSFARGAPRGSTTVLGCLTSNTVGNINPAATAHLIREFNRSALSVVRGRPRSVTTLGKVSLRGTVRVGTRCRGRCNIHSVVLVLSGCDVPPSEYIKVCQGFNAGTVSVVGTGPCALYRRNVSFSFRLTRRVTTSCRFSVGDRLHMATKLLCILEGGLCGKRAYLPHSGFMSITYDLLSMSRSIIRVYYSELVRYFHLYDRVVSGHRFLSLPSCRGTRRRVTTELYSIGQFVGGSAAISRLRVGRIRDVLNVRFRRLRHHTVFRTFRDKVLVLANNPNANGAAALGTVVGLFRGHGLGLRLTTPANHTTGHVGRLANERTGAVRHVLRIR